MPRCRRQDRLRRMAALTAPQARELILVFRAGAGVFDIPPVVRNALIAHRLINHNVVTDQVELTRDGMLVASTLIATDDPRAKL